MFNKRQDDLTVVFDKTWKANHNDDIPKAKEREEKFKKKMFKSNNLTMNTNTTPESRLNNLNNNMNIARNGQRQNNLNNILKKWN